MRFRNVFTIMTILAVVAIMLVTDPDLGLVKNLPFGAGPIASLALISKGILGPSLLYIVKKAMFDYPVADFEALGEKARETSTGAAIYALAISLSLLAFAGVIAAFIFA